MRIFSLCAATGEWTDPSFAIAAVVWEDGREIARFVGRAPDSVVSSYDEHVWAYVVPDLNNAGTDVTHSSSEELEEAFWAFWISQKEGATLVTHWGVPADLGLFLRCIERAPESRGGYVPIQAHEVESLLLVLGESSLDLNGYVQKHDLSIPFEGGDFCNFHPLYGALEQAVVWEHAFGRLQAATAC